MLSLTPDLAQKSQLNTAGNKKAVSDFIDYIRENLSSSTTSWKRIAAAFQEASEMYGTDSDSFKQLLKETQFHKSKASKFITIASSERLRNYEDQLKNVHSWGTLYEIATLSDEQFNLFCIEFNLDSPTSCPIISETRVAAFKRIETPKSSFKRFAFITIDEDALRGNLVDGTLLETITSTIKGLEGLSPYIKVEETGIADNQCSMFMAQVATTKDALVRNRLRQIIERKMANISVPKKKGRTIEQHFTDVWGISRQELMAYVTEGMAQEAFKYLGVEDEYNEAEFWNTAMDEVQRSRVKFIERARARANTADPQIA